MPIIRKILDVGPASRAVVLPKSWLEFYERETGEKIDHVAIEVDKRLTIEPYIKRKPIKESRSITMEETGT